MADARGTLLPGTAGRVYDTLALTEDNELTIALKTLGARMVSPLECRVITEVMTDLAATCGSSGCAGTAGRWRTSARTG